MGRRKGTSSGIFIGFIPNVERSPSGLEVRFLEWGEDGYFYQCSRLIIFVYDKRRKIQDVGNFIKALERTGETAGKDIKVYVDQSRSPV